METYGNNIYQERMKTIIWVGYTYLS